MRNFYTCEVRTTATPIPSLVRQMFKGARLLCIIFAMRVRFNLWAHQLRGATMIAGLRVGWFLLIESLGLYTMLKRYCGLRDGFVQNLEKTMNDTPRYRFINARPKLTLCIIQVVYFAFCFVILSTIPRDLPYIVGADAASWLEPAKSLLLHKDYVIYDRQNMISCTALCCAHV